MSELAIDANGEPFDVPANIAGWRVRRLQPDGRGRPELVYDAKGRPVVVPVDATFDDLFAAVGAGRYRLDPVDHQGRADAQVPTACTGYLQPVESASGPVRNASDGGTRGPASDRAPVQPQSELERLLAATVAANTHLAATVIQQFSGMIGAAGQLIAAADGASITTRQPPPMPIAAIESAEYEPEVAAPESAMPAWLDAAIAQVVQHVGPGLLAKLQGLPLGALLDWRQAAPAAGAPAGSANADHTPGKASSGAPQAATASAQVPPRPTTPSQPAPEASRQAPVAKPPTAASSGAQSESAETTPAPSMPAPAPPAAPPLEQSTEQPAHPGNLPLSSHLLQIWAGLSPEEQRRAERLIQRLTAAERAAWFVELTGLSVAEAVARVRHVLGLYAPDVGGGS